jgi:hypothetical protein
MLMDIGSAEVVSVVILLGDVVSFKWIGSERIIISSTNESFYLWKENKIEAYSYNFNSILKREGFFVFWDELLPAE